MNYKSSSFMDGQTSANFAIVFYRLGIVGWNTSFEVEDTFLERLQDYWRASGN